MWLPRAQQRRQISQQQPRTVSWTGGLLLLWWCCSWMQTLPVATARFVPDHMRAERPDLQSSRTIVGLCLLGLSVPVYVCVIALLVRRRKMYPLCQRGACCLTMLQVDGAIISTVNLALWILYPHGMPCAMQIVTLHLCSSYAALWLIRGWQHVFRIEILNNLSELDWRETRTAQLQAREAEMMKEQDEATATGEEQSPVRPLTPKEAGPDCAGPDPATETTATLIDITPETQTAHPVSPPAALHPLLVYPSMDPSSIPGSFFIRNRRLTSPRWICGVMLVWALLLLSTIVIPAVFDYDITLVNQWRHRHGLESDKLTNHYLHGAFFESPRCLWYSIKWLCFFGSMLCFACPVGLFCAYRVYLSSVGMKRRMQEQAEFAALMGHESAERGVTPSAASASATASSPVRTELDELAAVNLEMGVTVWVGVSNCLLIFALTAFDASHVNLTTALTIWQGLIVSGIMPLRKSYTIEARQRELFRRARVKSGTRFVASVEHHAPLYQLHHVLNDATAYPALLRFLQKEYSSENCLFFRACEEFCRAARKLERALSSRCAGWDLNPEETGEFTIIPQGLCAGRMFLPQLSSSHLVSSRVPAHLAAPVLPHQRWSSAQLSSFSIEPVPFVAASQHMPVSPCAVVREVSAVRTSSFSPPTMMTPPSTKGMHGSPTEFNSTPSAMRHGRAMSFSAKAQPLALPMSALQMVQLTQTPPRGKSQRSPSMSRVDSFCPRSPKWQPSMHLIESARATPAGRTDAVSGHSPLASTGVPMTPPKTAATAPPLTVRELHTEALSLRARAIQLYDDYIKHNAVLAVNVDASMQRFIGAQIQAITAWHPTILDDAGKPDIERAVRESLMPLPPPSSLSVLFKSAALSVFALIESDSFRRFLLTDDFQLLLQAADDAEMARRMAVASAEARTDVVLAKADEALRRCSRLRTEAALAALAHHSAEPTVVHPHSAQVGDSFEMHLPVASAAMFNVDEAETVVMPIDETDSPDPE